MSQIAIKFMANAALAHRLRAAALSKGTCTADIVRRACETHVDAPAPIAHEAVVERHRSDDGNVIVAAYLSNSLATAIKRMAAETGRSQSNVMRYLIRTQLRTMGRWGSPSATLTSTGAEPTAADAGDAIAQSNTMGPRNEPLQS